MHQNLHQQKKILTYIYPYISNHTDIKFLVAVGTHSPPNEDELRFIFGRFYNIFKEKIIIHYTKKKKNMKYLGKTKTIT